MQRWTGGLGTGRRDVLKGMLAAGATVAAAVPVGAQGTGAHLLMFDDPGCPYCRQWHREVGPGYANSPEGKRAPLRVLQHRGPRPADITLSEPVRATPTFVLVQDGREVGRIVGYPGADFFWSMIDNLMKKLRPGERAG